MNHRSVTEPLECTGSTGEMPPKKRHVPAFAVGDEFDYVDNSGYKIGDATIKKVHHDDPPELYFTIDLRKSDGTSREKQTFADRLVPLGTRPPQSSSRGSEPAEHAAEEEEVPMRSYSQQVRNDHLAQKATMMQSRVYDYLQQEEMLCEQLQDLQDEIKELESKGSGLDPVDAAGLKATVDELQKKLSGRR